MLAVIALLISAFRSLPGDPLLKYPASWPSPVYDFSKSPLSEEGIALGRELFYDPILSADSTISCANCHLSFTGFTHVDHKLSHGINDSIGTRNSLALMNLAWSKSFMWDGAVNHLDMQALAPISHPAEMGEDIAHVVEKLNRSERYRAEFNHVFGEPKATGETVLKALAQFQLTLVSANSKYDQVMRNEEGIHFTEQENSGYELFKVNCTSCHREPLLTTGEFANNGLTLDTSLMDFGRMMVTGDPTDSLKFKVPTLRNIEFSRPYMHDGRFQRLSEVIDHYASGVQRNSTLAPELQKPIDLNAEERVDLLAFLLTLSDKEFLFNPDLAFPRHVMVSPSSQDTLRRAQTQNLQPTTYNRKIQ